MIQLGHNCLQRMILGSADQTNAGQGTDFCRRVFRGESIACGAQHGQIILMVTHGSKAGCFQAQPACQEQERCALICAPGSQLQHVGSGKNSLTGLT